jgi:MoaA/NifB/PqqE/SkfB family radical SAM enzyme
VSGTHILFNEIQVTSEKIHVSPRVVSIALTNECNLNCDFCYAPKFSATLKPEYVLELCQVIDTLGGLEVAFGGGEPTLYPYLSRLCKAVWNSTDLGISITTNGHYLTEKLVDELNGNISIIRFSIDAMEPLYSKLRKRSIFNVTQSVNYVQDKIPFGINTLINDLTVNHLDDVLDFAIDHDARDILLLPQVKNGKFILNKNSWLKLENWINRNWENFRLEISTGARQYLNCPFLFYPEYEPRSSYWHIGANGKIRASSYFKDGEQINTASDLISFFQKHKSDGNIIDQERTQLI